MLTLENLKEFIDKYQTNERNIVREYIQHLFLAALYRMTGAEKLLFKGGTALRIIFNSPRFSEDLDFTGQGIYQHKEIDELFINALLDLEKAGINISYNEAKPTTGGYLGVIHYELFDLAEDIKFEVSLRKGKRVAGELASIVSDFTIPYTLVHFPTRELVGEKVAALLSRGKPRDYYDLYFILRHAGLNKFVDKKNLKAILVNLESEKIDFKRDLSVLLPASHRLLVKDLKKILKREIEKYIT
jgi:predicted nucleotidyltransferase component of viral defense system